MFYLLKIFIMLIMVCEHSKKISAELITNQVWPNIMEDLSLRMHQQKNVETHPLHEGFMLLPDESKKPVAKPKPINNSTTPCTTVMKVTIKRVSSPSPNLDHSVGHLGRRLLNEPSYDTDLDRPSEDNDWKMNDLIKIDMDEELNKQLFRFETTMDGSGETTEETTEQTSVSTTTTTGSPEFTQLSNNSAFILSIDQGRSQEGARGVRASPHGEKVPEGEYRSGYATAIDCSNANNIFNEILMELRDKFGPYDLSDQSEVQCNGSERINVTFTIGTNNNIQIQNNLFANLSSIAQNKGVDVYSVNKCGNNGIKPVINVTSCFLINLCDLCGSNPPRGICIPANKESRCECLPNKNDPSRPYSGEFCLASASQLTTPTIPSRWTPVIIGIVAGIAGLLFTITLCLWAIAIWRGRRNENIDLRTRRLWHLPRAQIPIAVTADNVQTFLSRTTSPSQSQQSDSENNPSIASDSSFFKDLDQRMGENLRATITRPNSSALLASLPSDTNSSLTNYDPIDELDSIIDHEDISAIFHDPMTDETQLLEAINPLFK